MRGRIEKWGHTLALRLPKQASDALGIRAGDVVSFEVSGDTLTVRPTQARRRYTIEELVAGITPENLPASFDDGPNGRETL